jgi:hypothetical protein
MVSGVHALKERYDGAPGQKIILRVFFCFLFFFFLIIIIFFFIRMLKLEWRN